MNVLEAVLLFGAAMIAGGMNSVAGGGSFLSFPMLMTVGVPSINANATNTIALWPGSLASVGAYRREFVRQNKTVMLVLILMSLAGGLFGAELLLHTSQETFNKLLPFLLLMATLLFTFGGNLMRATAKRFGRKNIGGDDILTYRPSLTMLAVVAGLQLIISIYGGYFGGGIGIMMLAALSLLGMTNIHTMNGLKTLLAVFINGIAAYRLAVSGVVFWPQAIVMIVGAVIGGYGGASLAQKINPQVVRRVVVLIAVSITIWFFVRTYLLGGS